MRRSKVLFLLLAGVLCLVLISAALAEGGPLSGLWTSGCQLLFHTDSVTVDGEANFSLDGEHFKTAELHYVQDGYSSFYGLRLLTPWDFGTQRESGWTIIADPVGDYAVMEVRHPGVYRMGTDSPQNTLLRSSVQLDALTELGGLLVKQLEPLLPEGTITVTQAEGAATTHISLKEDQIPDVAASALNVAAGYLADRWFTGGHDRSFSEDESAPFENYVTVTGALTNGTVRWGLKELQADFTADEQGRLTEMKGELRVESTFWDGVVREVEVDFHLTMTDYGESKVKPFAPDDYDVCLPWEIADREEAYENPQPDDAGIYEEKFQEAQELLEWLGYESDPLADWGGWSTETRLNLDITQRNGENFFFSFARDGRLLTLEHITVGWGKGIEAEEEENPELLEAAQALVHAFATDVQCDPEDTQLRHRVVGTDGGRYFLYGDDELEEVMIVVQAEPVLRLEYYDVQEDEDD